MQEKANHDIHRYIVLSISALLLLTACGGNDLDKLIETNKCVKCSLSGVDLNDANLRMANLTGAILDDVIGTGFTGALNVPEKYLRD